MPDEPIFVIGDVHGRADLLEKALAQCTGQTILVGDYVDRGEESASVLRMLASRPELVCLMGNHEEMLLSFLADPALIGSRWLRNGGLQTLASFGVDGVTETSSEAVLTHACDALTDAMEVGLIQWLKSLPVLWQSGNVAVLHAGADPLMPLVDQDPHTFLWGHPQFAKNPRSDGIWIAHGHTIVDEPKAAAGRISLDTGAYATGRLTVARIAEGKVDFDVIT